MGEKKSLTKRRKSKRTAQPKTGSLGADPESIQGRFALFCREVAVDLAKVSGEWDRPLTKAEVLRLRPEHKGLRPLVSFLRKVALMIEMIDDPGLRQEIPQQTYKFRKGLREWSDPNRRLWPWGDPLVDSPTGNYRKLTEIYFEAEEVLDTVRKGKGFSLERKLQEQQRVIESLEVQILDLMDQLNVALNNVR